ncbi:hypothetical protein HGA13_31690 [Nocardia speluncae]|uniref:Uncharacterized protein n=1 Tax=Nocardia speluncae TaxID=419477 RepID=A0A846XS70_9NOCA|nr:hypothetical protein [Nocardia speluncae]NKY37596.1 hypothetical protein [Nocardia speluncae]
MATGVGLHIAEYACTAAVVGDDGDPHFIIREPILHMSDDGDAELGGVTTPPGYTHTITGFVSAVADPAGVTVDDGEAYRGEDLLATAMFCLINLTADYLNGPAEFYATHPGGWPAAQVFALRGALDYLGLKSVALIGEDELPPRPGGHSADEIGRYFAESAGRAALAVVLETPAGATPPDPGTAENSFLDTVVMPKLGDTPAKAYSAVDPDPAYPAATADPYAEADPQADPEATYGGPSLGVLAAGLGVTSAAAGALPAADPGTPEASAQTSGPATTPPKGSARTPAPAEPKGSRRTAALIAVAALAGLLIGALGVTAFLRPGAAEPGPAPVTSPVTDTPALPPPMPPQPVAPPPAEPTYIPEPTFEPEPVETTEPAVTTPPPVTTTGQSEPPPVTSVPGTTEPSGPTLTEPTTSNTETTTTRARPGYEFFPFPMPFRSEDPDLPDTGSQEGRRQEAR